MPSALKARGSVWSQIVAAFACMLWLFLGGCAYFNTFYNAKQLYNQGENARTRPDAAEFAGAAEYKACIEKCLLLMRFHPNSKYVQDSLYLIGMSHLHRGEYVQSQASFQDLLDRYPDGNYAERAYFNQGLAALKLDDLGRASRIFSTLQEFYPESKFNVEAAFRTAEVQLDSRDYEAARAELKKFIKLYPKSPFVVDAQVQVARTYFDEQLYSDARREYAEILQKDPTEKLAYEAKLHIALAEREDAEVILSDPALYTDAETGKSVKAAPKETPPDSVAQALPDSAALGSLEQSEAPALPVAALPESLRVVRQQAEDMLAKAGAQLQSLQKTATRLGSEFEHRIEVAVTRALLGEPDAAISELDQISRTKPRSEISAQALYEMGEIHRRNGDLKKARESYDNAARQTRDSSVNHFATAKSAAIQARATSMEKLGEAPAVRRRYRVARGLEAPKGDEEKQPQSRQDSLAAIVALETKYNALAGHRLRIAEIDIFELDQPRLALRGFQKVLDEFPGSSQCPRAAFAIGWIYQNVLFDVFAAQAAYKALLRDYPDSHQAREAAELLGSPYEESRANPEVIEPYSRP